MAEEVLLTWLPPLKVLGLRSSDLSDLCFQLVEKDALVFRIVNRRDNRYRHMRF